MDTTIKLVSVTVIIPTYNGARWVRKSIESVLIQSFKDFELIIIDDGSSDETESIVREFMQHEKRIRYIKNEKNFGIQKTRNIALEKSCGKYIAEIDQDDEWIDPDKLKTQFEFMEKNSGCVLIGTGAIVVDQEGIEIAKYLMPENDSVIRKKILRMNCFIHSSVMYRAKLVKDIGGYTLTKMSEDHDLWLRLGRIGSFRNLQTYSVKYYFNPKGYNSQNKILRLQQNLLFIKEHKDFYPNHVLALCIGVAKIFFVPLFNIMPMNIKGLLLQIHKKL